MRKTRHNLALLLGWLSWPLAAVVSAPPQITGFEPTTLLAGQTVVINGSGFAPGLRANTVRIGVHEARVLAAAEKQLTALVPFGTATGVIAVKTAEGEASSTDELTVRTSLSGFVENTQRQPLRGVTVRLANTELAATTDAEGFFLLPELAPGAFIVEVDGTSLPAAYPKFALRVDLAAQRDNQFARPLTLQPANGARHNLGARGPARVTTTLPTALGELAFELPGNASARLPDGTAVNSLALTLVEESRLPVALPAGYFSPLVAQLTPFGATFSPGGRLSFPNTAGWPAGTQARLFRFDQSAGVRYNPATTSPTLGSIVETGTATVSADGRRVETAADAIREATCYFVALPQPVAVVSGRVAEADGTTPARNAFVRGRGQTTVTDENGSFTLRNVPVSGNAALTVEISLLRPQGRVERTERPGVQITAGVTTELTPDIALPAETSNRAPVLLAPANVVAQQGETNAFDFVASDPDGRQTLQVAVTGAPFATIAPSIGPFPYRLLLAPGPNELGQHTLTLTATDEAGASTTHRLTVNINRLPVALGQAVITDEDTRRNLTLAADDPDGEPLRFFIVTPPAHGVLNGVEPNLSYLPTANYYGTDSFTFAATDGFGISNTAQVTLFIRPVNDPPVLTGASVSSAFTGETLRFTLSATDPEVTAIEGQTLTFAATNLPGGARFTQFNDTSAQFTWTPDETQHGTYRLSFSVTDDGAPVLRATKEVTLTVLSRWRATATLEGGWVLALLSAGEHLLAGVQSGRLFISDNQGESWTAANTDFTASDVHAFAARGATLFAGVSGSVYRSTDQGRNWAFVSRGLPYIRALAASENALFAATDAGLFRSADQGASWQPRNAGLTNQRVRAVLMQGNRLIAGTEGGLFISDNQGEQWTAVNVGLPPPSVRALALSGATLLAGTNRGVLRSTDQGLRWTPLDAGLFNRDVWSLALGGAAWFAGTGNAVYRSTDQGESWLPLTEGLGSDAWGYALATSNTHVFVGAYDGLFRSPDQGQTWTAAQAGLTAVRIASFAANEAYLFAGSLGAGFYRSSDAGQSWVALGAGVPRNADVRALVTQGANLCAATNRGIFISPDQGQSWYARNNGVPTQNTFALLAQGTELLAGTQAGGIYRSTDQGLSWAATNAGVPPNANVVALLSSDAVWLAGTNGNGLFRSLDNGRSWLAANEGIERRDISALARSATALWAGTFGGGVFVSTDQGQSWLEVNEGLPRRDVLALATQGEQLWVGTGGGGVFLSSDYGQSWQAVNPGLANPVVNAFIVRGAQLFAGTRSGVFVRGTD